MMDAVLRTATGIIFATMAGACLIGGVLTLAAPKRKEE